MIFVFLLAFVAVVYSCPATIGSPPCNIFPPGDEWNRDISNDPVDYMSSCYVSAQMSAKIHMDMGVTETYYGIPFNIVHGQTQSTTPLYYYGDAAYGSCCSDYSCTSDVCECSDLGVCTDTCCDPDYSDESDLLPSGSLQPFPLNANIEGYNSTEPTPPSGDRHLLIVDVDNCLLYETWNTQHLPDNGGYVATNSAKFDLKVKNYNRLNFFSGTNSVTSADAAGLPIFPGLLKYSEAAAGPITHALRFTLDHAQNAYTLPATHFGPKNTVTYPPYGTRFRLKASFSETPFQGNQVALNIVQGLKNYGIIFADQGSNMYISGVTDPGWGSGSPSVMDLIQDNIAGSDFEAVQSPNPIVRGFTPSSTPICNGVSANTNPSWQPTANPADASCPIYLGLSASAYTPTPTPSSPSPPTSQQNTTSTPTLHGVAVNLQPYYAITVFTAMMMPFLI